MSSSLEEKLTQHLAAQCSSFPELAAQTGLPESALHTLCVSPAVKLLKQLAAVADVLGVSRRALLPAGTAQSGLINQAGTGNRQTINVGKGAARILAAQLRDC